jgi:phenylacetate-CoA ligase
MTSGADREAIYRTLPIPLQNVAVSLEGRRLIRRRYGPDYDREFLEAVGRMSMSTDDIQRYREARMRDFMVAAAHAPFWRERFRTCGVDCRATDPFGELAKLPILSKELVKSDTRRIAVPDNGREKSVSCHTSGTTGSGLIFPATGAAERAQWAVWWRYRGWHGITRDTWCGYFGGRSLVPLAQRRPPYWRINVPARQLMFSGYHLTAETAGVYVAEMTKRRLEWLHGYPSLLALLAGYIVEQRLAPLPPVRVVTTGAENLSTRQRERIRNAFGAPVFQHYGQAEGTANISECEHGRLHVDEDFSFVEFVPAFEGGSACRIVGTNWTNPAFPLIRYDCGDLATLSEGACRCGRTGRLVERVDGRKEDYLILSSGARIGRLDHIFKDLVHVREAQIRQREPGRAVFRIVKGDGYDAAGEEKRLLTEARTRLGDETRIDIEYVAAIPRTRSGKLRLVVSEIPEGRIADEADPPEPQVR